MSKEAEDRQKFNTLRQSAKESIQKNRLDAFSLNKQAGASLKKERDRISNLIK